MNEKFSKIRYAVICEDGHTIQIRKCKIAHSINDGFVVVENERKCAYRVLSVNLFNTFDEANERRHQIIPRFMPGAK